MVVESSYQKKTFGFSMKNSKILCEHKFLKSFRKKFKRSGKFYSGQLQWQKKWRTLNDKKYKNVTQKISTEILSLQIFLKIKMDRIDLQPF